MYGNPTFDCDGAQHSGALPPVGHRGDDHRPSRRRERRSGQPVHPALHPRGEACSSSILSGVTSFTPKSFRCCSTVDDVCTAAGVEWSLIASQPVSRAARIFDDRVELPTAASVADALNHFADAVLERRRLLPLLTKSA